MGGCSPENMASSAVTTAKPDEIGETSDSVPTSNARYTNTRPSTWQIAVPAMISHSAGVLNPRAGWLASRPIHASRLRTWIATRARAVPTRRVRWVMRKSPRPHSTAASTPNTTPTKPPARRPAQACRPLGSYRRSGGVCLGEPRRAYPGAKGSGELFKQRPPTHLVGAHRRARLPRHHCLGKVGGEVLARINETIALDPVLPLVELVIPAALR